MIITKRGSDPSQKTNVHRKIDYGDTLGPKESMQMLYGLTDYVSDGYNVMIASIDGCGEVCIPVTSYASRRGEMRRYATDDVVMLRDLLFVLNGCGRATKMYGVYESLSCERSAFDADAMRERRLEVSDMLESRGYCLLKSEPREWVTYGYFYLYKS